MCCFHYSDDLFNMYCIHSINSLFFKYPETWRRILYILTFTNHCYICYQRKLCFKLRKNPAQSDLKGECAENMMTVYEMQEEVGSFYVNEKWMWTPILCNIEIWCGFFCRGWNVMNAQSGSLLQDWLIKIRGFTKKKYGNSWKWAGLGKPKLHFIPFSFNGFN